MRSMSDAGFVWCKIDFFGYIFLFEVRSNFLHWIALVVSLLSFRLFWGLSFRQVALQAWVVWRKLLLLFSLAYWFLVLGGLLLNDFLVHLSSLALHLIPILMQAEQLALTLHVFLCKTPPPVEMSASIYKKHLIGFFISDISNNEILD